MLFLLMQAIVCDFLGIHFWNQPPKVEWGAQRDCRCCGRIQRFEQDEWNSGVWRDVTDAEGVP